MIATPAVASALKAGAVATGLILLFWAALYTPVGVFFFLLIDGFVVGPLEGVGWVDRERKSEKLFALYVASVLIAAVAWLLFFLLFFSLFRASAERKSRIAEEEGYE